MMIAPPRNDFRGGALLFKKFCVSCGIVGGGGELVGKQRAAPIKPALKIRFRDIANYYIFA